MVFGNKGNAYGMLQELFFTQGVGVMNNKKQEENREHEEE
jgi:hypothetical protein